MKLLRQALPILFAGALIAFLFSRVDRAAIGALFVEANFLWILLAIAILSLGHLFSIVRWKYLLSAINIRLSLGEAAKIYFANLPVAKWTPAYSGDFLRAVYLKHRLQLTEGAAIITIESLTDVSTLFAFITLGALLLREWHFVAIGMLGIFFMIVALFFFRSSFIGRFLLLQRFMLRFREVFRSPACSPRMLLIAFLFSVLAWLPTIVFVKMIFFAFGEGALSFAHIFTVQPLVTLLALLPVTLGGLGTREAAMIYFYGSFVNHPLVFMVGLTYSFVSLIVFPLIGVIFMLNIFRPKQKSK